MMQLHYLKQAIGEQGYGAGAKVEGVLTQEARRARNQYRDLANTIGEMTQHISELVSWVATILGARGYRSGLSCVS